MSKLSSYEHSVRALVYAESPEKRQRVVHENTSRSLLPRLAIQASYGFIYNHPVLTHQILAAPYRVRGLDVIAFGRNSTAIRDNDTVIKIARASEGASVGEQAELVEELVYRHAVSKEYLGPICIDQEFSVIPHPLRKTPIVAAAQQFVEFYPFNIGMVPDPEQKPELEKFARISLEMEAATDLLTDVSGTNNFGFDTTNKLVLVDTIPLKATDGGPSIELAERVLADLIK